MRAWLAVIAVTLGGCSVISGTESGIPDPGPGGLDAGRGRMDTGMMARPDSGPMPDVHVPGDPDSGPAARDAGPIARDAGPLPRDSGPIAPTRAVQCGDVRCTGMQACCVTTGARSCIDSAMSECRCDMWGCDTTVVGCDGPSDCPPTQVCCASRGLTEDVAERFACQERCESETLVTRTEVCQDGDGIACRDGSDCQDLSWLPDGYRGCSG